MTSSPSTPAEQGSGGNDASRAPADADLAGVSAHAGGRRLLRELLRATRPRQWAKNVLVLAAPLVGGGLEEPGTLLLAALALVTFTMASAGVYLINDIVDVDLDRAHPTKCTRPLASGAVPLGLAKVVAIVLFLASCALSLAVNRGLVLVILVYIAMSVAYSLRLKNEPVIELVIVASGFLLRALAGGVATGIDLSHWFILTAGFGSLFVAAGKRYAERRRADEGAIGRTRPVLAAYTTSYLRFVWTLSAAAVCLTYAQWALSRYPDVTRGWSIVSLGPFLVALLRYAVDVDRGHGGEPEEIILRSKPLMVLGALWAAALLVAMYR